MLETGLEPVRGRPRGILSPLRLPIPPLQQYFIRGTEQKKCYEALYLEAPSRLELEMEILQTCALPLGYGAIIIKKWSGRRDSNSRHMPWQGIALPLSHSRITWSNKLVGTIGLEPMTSCL